MMGGRQGGITTDRRILPDDFTDEPEKDHGAGAVMHGDDDQIVPLPIRAAVCQLLKTAR